MRTATLDLNSRGSFVDDLNSKPGIVMCRDALLHRSHEIQPEFFDSEKKQICLLFFFVFTNFGIGTWHTKFPPKAMLPSGQCRVGPKEKKKKKLLRNRESNPGHLRDRQRCYQLHHIGMEYLGFDPSTSCLLSTHASDCANTPSTPVGFEPTRA